MSNPFSQRRLGEILTSNKYIDETDIVTALEKNDERIGEALINTGKITDKQLAEALAEQFHYQYVDLESKEINEDIFEMLPANIANKYQVVPLEHTDNVLSIAIHDPFDLILIDKLENITKKQITVFLSAKSDILSILQQSSARSEILQNISEDFKPVIIKEDESGAEHEVDLVENESDAPVIKLVYSIISAALQKRASDIHIEVYADGIKIKYRIDGVLYPATETLDKQYHSALISRLKVMSELDIAEKRIPQDGKFKLRLEARQIDFRVSILPSIFGENVVVRILDKNTISSEFGELSIKSLGLSGKATKTLQKAINEPYGMVLITGPTGSGKTTTLYASLSELNTGYEKIITIEDPVEYELEGIVQIPVNEKKQLTFSKGLRSILRHDPDKIMVGEIRDTETAQIAVQSALTGHLVFTTVHANNAFDVIGRFSHMGVNLNNFITALNCIVAQRLVRKLCNHCKEAVEPPVEKFETSEATLTESTQQQWYSAKGCERCDNTGYRGRIAVMEILNLTPALRGMIINNAPIDELYKIAIDEGMETLRESAERVAHQGFTTLDEINRVTFVE
ncbi:Type IV fimbrial assembly, ATPase PilB [hydrothermal vent metagenome]|uniref:Type IV fimbrial assembly, ATPase PilB n=1 Tax=hydrothermal vent metagenome TaxID=652676 RepID=A0A3B0YWE7_9ZZZZ